MTGWCILRTAPSQTLRLTAALTDAGFTVWTPSIEEERRVSRSRKRQKVMTAILPGFVFGPYDRVHELNELARSPAQTYQVWSTEERRMVIRGYPYFRVYRHLERFPWIADAELDPLRLAEQQGRPKAAAVSFKAGDQVKHPGSGFEGLIGTVQGTKGRLALVVFPGLSIPVHVEPRQLIAA